MGGHLKPGEEPWRTDQFALDETIVTCDTFTGPSTIENMERYANAMYKKKAASCAYHDDDLPSRDEFVWNLLQDTALNPEVVELYKEHHFNLDKDEPWFNQDRVDKFARQFPETKWPVEIREGALLYELREDEMSFL